MRAILLLLACATCAYALLLIAVYFGQRSLLYFPSHQTPTTSLQPWELEGETIGYRYLSANSNRVWLFLHGNAGQAAHRDYVLPLLGEDESLFVLEYPG